MVRQVAIRTQKGEWRIRWRSRSSCLLLALVAWVVVVVLGVVFSHQEQPVLLDADSSPPPLDLSTRWKTAGKTDVNASRRFLSTLLSTEYFQGKALEPEEWESALLNGVGAMAAESMILLLDNIRPPNVRLAHCMTDLTLDPVPRNISRIIIASNQHQSQDILPNFIKQILDFILDNPQITFFVSIYESGSIDRTPYLLSLLESVLNEIGVRNAIIYNGSLTRRKGQERIEFLAQVRNAALKPLSVQAKQGIHYDRMIFINDVFFCKQDMQRLLQHHGDLNCGMDFTHHVFVGRNDKFDPNEIEHVKRMYYRKRLKDDPDAQKAFSVPLQLRRWNKKTHTEPYRYIADDTETWMDFYDIWVSHDASGRHLLNFYPYVRNDTYEAERLSKGLPFPGECCWNGVAILNPEPFVKHNVQFRASSSDECRTSECVLMCHDFQRLGYRKVTIDPSVWTTYTYQDARLLQLIGVRGMRRVPWDNVRKASPMRDIHIENGQLTDCCPLQPGKEIVIFEDCLTDYSIWNVSSALERHGMKEFPSLDTVRTIVGP